MTFLFDGFSIIAFIMIVLSDSEMIEYLAFANSFLEFNLNDNGKSGLITIPYNGMVFSYDICGCF